MTDQREVAVVTGGNRGLGLEVCRQLAAAGLRVVQTGRDEAAAAAATADGPEPLRRALEARALDVADPASIAAFAAWVARELPGIDVLVNNAGIAMNGFNAEVARRTIDTNFHGPARLTDALLPAMGGRGRIVMVSSGLGQLSALRPPLRAQFAAATNRTDLDGLVEAFVADVAAGRHAARGWPSSAYNVSKVALNALTRILAREQSPTALRINAVCPGWVRTDMGGRGAARSVAEGASGIVWAALLPADGPTGGFFRDGQPTAW